MYPIRLGSPHDFDIVRELFSRAAFTEPAIATRIGAPLLTQPSIDAAAGACRPPADLLDLLIHLFVYTRFVDNLALRQCLSPAEMEALERLGLIARNDEISRYSPVCLCPVAGVYTVSDSWRTPGGVRCEGSEDIVYPAVVPNTRLFLDLLPASSCDSLLDLCSGTAVAALVAASSYAREAHAYDIAARSTHFAEFAKRLNGLSNIYAATGDLYEPARGGVFDRIVAHPPYVPVLSSQWVFQDGGDDGERVTRRIVAGLPEHLAPGGTLYSLAMASDRANAPVEDRIRGWLGAARREFDIAVVVRRVLDPGEFAVHSATRPGAQNGEARKWKELFETRGITGLPYATIMVQRKAAGRAPFTVRRQIGSKTSRTDHERLLEWETMAASNPDRVIRCCPMASPGCELQVSHRLENGEWSAVEYTLLTGHPFRMEMKVAPWLPYLIARSDGATTVSELFENLKANGILNPATPLSDFAKVVASLVSAGFLEIPE